ncbi:uncharacterized protein PAC_02142 [Phialocephala subalpina]|uniref:Uncharacterized protein n=1 Tax=Phialocephala subalpina TaxID=576137 RepID=A0A1L7WHL5_9HELO|nr:uncharacterized protein PAC_02142 [Phialocephala subalpina]
MSEKNLSRKPAVTDRVNTEGRNDDLVPNQPGPHAEPNLPTVGHGALPTRGGTTHLRGRGHGREPNSALRPTVCPHTDLREGQVHRTGVHPGDSGRQGWTRLGGFRGNVSGLGRSNDLRRLLARQQERRAQFRDDDLMFFGGLIKQIQLVNAQVQELKKGPGGGSYKDSSPMPSTPASRLPQIYIPIQEQRNTAAPLTIDDPAHDIEHFPDSISSPAPPLDDTPLPDEDPYLDVVMQHYLSGMKGDHIPTQDLKDLKEIAKKFRGETQEKLDNILGKQLLVGFDDVPGVPENELGLVLPELVSSMLRDLFFVLEKTRLEDEQAALNRGSSV